jgi:lysozyme
MLIVSGNSIEGRKESECLFFKVDSTLRRTAMIGPARSKSMTTTVTRSILPARSSTSQCEIRNTTHLTRDIVPVHIARNMADQQMRAHVIIVRKLIALGVLAAVIAAIVLWPGIYARLELAPLRYSVIGVDVSHHQGVIDWNALARAGAGFAYIKATEGENFRDPSFATNWNEAANAGVSRGAYHFFTQCRTGLDQARNFIAAVPRDPRALPPAIDAESMDPCSNGARVANIAPEIEAFLSYVEAYYGRRPIIYTTAEFHDAYLSGHFEHEQFWIRSMVMPPLVRWRQWIIWQYQNRGRRAGVQGPVDLNAFRGSKQDFTAFAQVRP